MTISTGCMVMYISLKPLSASHTVSDCFPFSHWIYNHGILGNDAMAARPREYRPMKKAELKFHHIYILTYFKYSISFLYFLVVGFIKSISPSSSILDTSLIISS